MLSGLTGHLPEIIIVLVVILIIWGPGKLPDVGAAMGKGIREFRKASSDTHDAVMGTTTTPAPAQPVPVVPVVAAAAPAPVQPAEPVTVPADATTHQPSVSG
jgi:sec-independent protein translocase protein TatA